MLGDTIQFLIGAGVDVTIIDPYQRSLLHNYIIFIDEANPSSLKGIQNY